MLDEIGKAIGVTEDADLVAETQQLAEERDALYLLAMAESEASVDNFENAQHMLTQLVNLYGEERLDGTAENAVFTDYIAALYIALRDQLAAA